MKEESKKVRAWDAWLTTLSPMARAAMQQKELPENFLEAPKRPPNDSEDDFHEFCKGLSPLARESIEAQVNAQITIEEEAEKEAEDYQKNIEREQREELYRQLLELKIKREAERSETSSSS